MIDPKQLHDAIVRPTLLALGEKFASEAAVKLVMLTIAHESACGRYIKQKGGPALGIVQMEPVTHDDIWENYIRYKPELLERLKTACGITEKPEAQRLVYDLRYAVAMCRIHYRRVKAPLPDAGNIPALAQYWKAHYNTELGKGRVVDFMKHYEKYIKGIV